MSSCSTSVMECQWLLFLLFFLLNCVVLSGGSSDKAVLLEFKKSVSDPSGLLSTWTETSHHCSWSGVLCDRNFKVLSLNVTGHARRREGNYSDKTAASAYFSCSDYRLFPFYGFGIRKSCGGTNGSLFGTLLPSIGKLSELRILSFPFNRLSGEIPVEIWGLKRLEVLDLENNLFSGSFPASISGLENLRVLNLGLNNISGQIPGWLSSTKYLEILNLAFNPLNGTVPGFLGRLRGVHLSFTWLDGDLPPDIGDEGCKLEYLDLSGNFLGGWIPASLGNCSQLKSLLLFMNLLEGGIPAEIGHLQNLEVLDVSRNALSGPIPAELGKCSGLTVLVLSNLFSPFDGLAFAKRDSSFFVNDDFNYYQGGIPDEITKLPKLRLFWAPRATLEGNLPSDWGSCDNLEMVNLGGNFLSGELPTGLTLCKKLRYLDLSSNKRLSGELMEELPIPCMTVFDVSENSFSGSISGFYNHGCPDILTSDSYSSEPFNPISAYLSFFASKTHVGKAFRFFGGNGGPTVFHNFGANNFTGNVSSFPLAPQRLGKQISYAFYAGENLLNGTFPGNLLEDYCNGLDSLFLNVSYNNMSGQIPTKISTCKSLHFLDVSVNQLSGSIPSSVGDLVSLVYLNISWNLLEDQIPISFKQMKDLTYISLAGNNLTGPVPSDIGQLQSLELLDLSSNFLSGEIPVDLVNLRNLTILLLDNNELSGQIPSGLANVTTLTEFNVSFNNLSGPLPPSKNLEKCSSLFGNPFLWPCDGDSLIPSSNHTRPDYSQRFAPSSPPVSSIQGARKIALNPFKIASIAFVSTISSVLAIVIFVCYGIRKWNSKIVPTPNKEITIFTNIGVPLTFDGIMEATNNFDSSNRIGSGGFGSTYKAEISPGIQVAIKRLANGRPEGFQQFEAEIRTLGRLHHENLVTLIGYHSSESETFIIYNYLPGGNLQKFILERSAKALNWKILHKIALDVAKALQYLHDSCEPRVLHRDVKPSNILLDEDCNAYLSDFGLAKLMGNSRTHITTGVAGTFGYVAPEYTMLLHVTDKSDVYSYGVVLLELLTDKKVLDPSFFAYGDGFNLVKWSRWLVKQGRHRDFFDPGLWNAGPQLALREALHLGVICTLDLFSRPTIQQVVLRLQQLQPPPE